MPPFSSNAYTGELHPEHDTPELRAWMTALPASEALTLISDGRDKVYRAPIPANRFSVAAVKRIAPETRLKTWVDQRCGGGRAARAHAISGALETRGVPVPLSVAYMERVEKGRFTDQWHISEFLDDRVSFREALLHHYHEDPLCRHIMALLEGVAGSISRMHTSGVMHRDLGNQNILLRQLDDGRWAEPCFIDLNRVVLREKALTPEERGRDCARIALPSDLRRVFFQMMDAPEVLPDGFLKAEKRARARFDFHTQSRAWRHPIRTQRLRKTEDSKREYPEARNFWIWDDKSMQAIPAMKSRDRRKHYRALDGAVQVATLVKRGPAIRSAYRDLVDSAWTKPVDMSGRVTVAINAEPDRIEQEREWLNKLSPTVPVHVRLYYQADSGERRVAREAVRTLHADGHPVSIAFVQDRRAVLCPKGWADFVAEAASSLSGVITSAEAGHAVNRVKWGIWDLKEYAQLMQAFENWSSRFPTIPLTGPAGIDFEMMRVLPLMDQLPSGLNFSALSHHMYVDRRGAPENFQGKYDTLRKLALMRAIARVHPNCEDRLDVSEVNWPLLGTGEWSPVGSPYVSPGPRNNDPSVNEDQYAAYMIRYLLIALCSGMADRVVWWNLAAHGFGLIDDLPPGDWRPRPAFFALRDFLSNTEGATFMRRETEGETIRYRFSSDSGGFAYSYGKGESCEAVRLSRNQDPAQFTRT